MSTMTLEQVRDDMLRAHAYSKDEALRANTSKWVSALDAHIAQPAQTVDVGAPVAWAWQCDGMKGWALGNVKPTPENTHEFHKRNTVVRGLYFDTRALSGEKSGLVDVGGPVKELIDDLDLVIKLHSGMRAGDEGSPAMTRRVCREAIRALSIRNTGTADTGEVVAYLAEDTGKPMSREIVDLHFPTDADKAKARLTPLTRALSGEKAGPVDTVVCDHVSHQKATAIIEPQIYTPMLDSGYFVIDKNHRPFFLFNRELIKIVKTIDFSTRAVCTTPPEGWFCTIEDGHEGPCAAWPNSKLTAENISFAREMADGWACIRCGDFTDVCPSCAIALGKTIKPRD